MGVGNSEKLATQAKQALNKQADLKREVEKERVAEAGPRFKNEKVWMPNALGVTVRPFLEARSRMHKKQNDVFENPIKLVKDPKPDAHYGWARLNAPVTVMRAGQGAYRYVKPDEVKSSLADMFTNHKGSSGLLVCFGSLVLVEIPQQAWEDYFIEPEIEAVARLASQQAQTAAVIEKESDGRVKMVVEATEERETF